MPGGGRAAIALPINLSQHPDPAPPAVLVFLPVDREFGESPIPESSTCMRAMSSGLPVRPGKGSHGKKVAKNRLVMNGKGRARESG